MLPKSLINFLFIPVAVGVLSAITGGLGFASDIVSIENSSLPKKRTHLVREGKVSAAAMPVRFTWQTIRSLGQGTKMSTSAETFSAIGAVVPVGVSKWVLKLSGREVPVFVTAGTSGVDGSMYIEQQNLLRILGVVLSPSEISLEPDALTAGGKGESIQIALSRTPNRHMETVYRSPEEELFLLKASVFLMPK